MKEERRSFYERQAGILTAEIRKLRKRNTGFAVSELLTFGLAIAAVVAYVSTDTGYTFLYIGSLMLVVYILIRRADISNANRITQQEYRRSVYQKELAYLRGDFSGFEDGVQYSDPQHPYTFDMDIFGRDSLFNRINRTITSGGSDRLAKELMTLGCENIQQRQEAIRELADQETLRSTFLAYGQRKTINTSEILSVLHGIEQSTHAGERLGVGAAILSTIGLWIVIVLAVADVIPSSISLLWVFLQFGIVFALNNTAFRQANKAANRMYKELRTYVSLIELITKSMLTASESQRIIGRLKGEQGDALESFTKLQRILDGLDRQGNPLYRFLSDAFFCYDFWIVRRFRQWLGEYLHQVEDWIEVVSHFDMLVSMATFRYNEPTAIDAEIVEADSVVYDAEGLCHPFLGERAVSNDFTLQDNHYYIITGANMAGKSTFLRTIGVNYILARCGMPVFAKRFRASRFALFSSMRTTDDLTQGISYFNAELLRLQLLIDFCRHQPRTLIILDEILKGTNSLDKLNGSRLFLEYIQQLPVTGIIATHDLALSKMADEHLNRFHNYCFEIELSDQVTYTYKITEGVARNQNATFLLQNIVLSEHLSNLAL
ncbi:MAG: DNA mismatch repair protein MutS [Prevotella sp.]|nr:DNA mismatch repair protein MutS [Prevotella sp.]